MDNDLFSKFLSKITSFIFAYAITNPGLSALRAPVYVEMIKLWNKQQCDFADYKFNDKKRYYLGYTDAKGKEHKKSIIAEYDNLTKKDDFTENDIIERDDLIHEKFIQYLGDERLLSD